MRITWVPLLIAVVLCGACQQGAKAPAQLPTAQPATAAAPWLDPQAQLSRAVRLITPAGVDLRQAGYLRDGSLVRIVALTRDYSERAEGKSDPQTLQLLPTGPGQATALEPGADYLPLKLLFSPGRTSFCLSAVKRGEGVRLEDAPLHILQYQPDGTLRTWDQASAVVPRGYLSERLLLCRNVARRERSGGLAMLTLDYSTAAQVFDLQTGKLKPTTGTAFAGNADGSCIAGYTLRYDPALPAQAAIEYSASGKAGRRAVWSFPYHVSYAAELWEPPLAFIDANHLATIAFRPDAMGRGDKANYQGLFRLVALDTDTGQSRLVEDRVQPYMSLVAGAGLVFYTMRFVSDSGPVWEVWAATADGLNKQRLWQEPNAEYISVEDLLDGRRLLVQRMYAAFAGSEPVLHSELSELSLAVLEQSTIAVPEDSPAPPAAAEDASTAPPDLFNKAGKAEAKPAPPKERDKGDGGGGEGLPMPPASGGEGGTPPPIAVP